MPNAKGFRRLPTAMALLLAAAAATFPVGSLAQLPPSEMMRVNDELAEAGRLQSQAKHEQAIALLEGTLARLKSRVGPVDPVLGALKTSLGSIYGYGNQYEKAETMFREAIAIGKAQPDRDVDFRSKATDGLVQILIARGKYVEALPICEDSLKEAEARFGVDDSRTEMTRQILANAYLFAKRPDAAIPLGRRSLKSAEAAHGADAPQTIHSRNTVATALMNSGKYGEAAPLFETSLAIARKRLPPTDQFTIASLNGLAGCYQNMGRAAEAQALATEAGTNVLGRPGSSPDQVVDALNMKALSAASAGDFKEAESLFLQALKVGREKLGTDHPKTGGVLTNLSGLYINLGRFGEGERLIQEALAIVEKNPGPRTVAAAKVNNALAMVYFKTARYDDAVPLLEKAREILEVELERGHPEIAYLRYNLATVYSATDNFGKSAALSEESLADVEGRLGPNNRMVGLILVNLGASYGGLLQFGKAESAFRRASAIFEKIDPGSDGAAIADSALSEACRFTGKIEEAEALARRAVHAHEGRLGREHPETSTALDNLSMLLAGRGRISESADVADAARRSWRAFLLKTLPALPEDDQILMIASGERHSLDGALTLALEQRSEPEIARRSAEWVLNGKALTLQALAMRGALTRAANSPETSPILAELDAVRNRLATLAFARPGIEDQASAPPGEEYKSLVARERDLSRRLGLTLHLPKDVDRWVELSQVRGKIPTDAVLVEFARVRVTLFSMKEILKKGLAGPRYAAWVIPPEGQGEVRLVDLGPADVLERAVSEANQALQPDPARPILPGDEPDAEKRALAALGALADRLLKPLRAQLDPARRWVISPDSALWLVPWAALPVGDGRYSVERHLIHLAVSGRDLLDAREAAKAAPPAILADPDYDLAPDQVVAAARAFLPGATSARGPFRSPLRSETLSERFERLPGTKDEAEEIRPLMAAYAGVEPQVFLEGAASETVFKGLRGPKALVLSTHGFFLPSPEPDPDARPRAFGPPRPDGTRGTTRSPLLRCGLILAGYNNHAKGPAIGDTDDGLLTGLEVASVDLRGTDLVVLSACRTGLGDVRVGEGVAGLRQVFQVAGAGGVVASLWSIQDFESYQLMSAFFHGLAHRRGPATALRDAQLALIRDRRTRLGAAHPTFWAAFTLTGFPGPSWRDEALVEVDSSDLPPVPRSRPKPPGLAGAAISPVTGRPASGNPWSDSALAAILLAVGSWVGRWWWRLGGSAVS